MKRREIFLCRVIPEGCGSVFPLAPDGQTLEVAFSSVKNRLCLKDGENEYGLLPADISLLLGALLKWRETLHAKPSDGKEAHTEYSIYLLEKPI